MLKTSHLFSAGKDVEPLRCVAGSSSTLLEDTSGCCRMGTRTTDMLVDRKLTMFMYNETLCEVE